MHLTKVSPPKLSPLKGLLAIACIVAAIIADWFLAQAIGLLLGQTAVAVAFWGVGMVVALFAMRRYVLSYSYIMSGTLLRISFAYGRYERVMTDIYFNNVLFAGSVEDAKRRYPGARVNKAYLKRAPLGTMAIACRDNGKPTIYVIQPDDVIRERLSATGKKKKQ